jgi:hypothetical protein
MRISPVVGAVAMCVCFRAANAGAQNATGRWEGTVTSPDGPYAATLTLDSAAGGWRGSILAPAYHPEAMSFATVTVHADTITMTLPVESSTATFRGRMTADAKSFSGQVTADGADYGTFSFTRAAGATAPASPPRRHQASDNHELPSAVLHSVGAFPDRGMGLARLRAIVSVNGAVACAEISTAIDKSS